MKKRRKQQINETIKGLASSKTRYFAVGTLVFLLCLIGLIERTGYVGRIVSFIFVYLMGYFYIAPLIVGLFLGAYYIVRRRKVEFEIAPSLIAFAFVIFFCLLWVSHNDAPIRSSLSIYSANFNAIDGKGYKALIDANVGGGIIGYFFYSLLATMGTKTLATIIHYVGFILSLLFLFKPLIDFIVKKVSASMKNTEPKKFGTTKEPIKGLVSAVTPMNPPVNYQALKAEEEMLSKIKVVDTSPSDNDKIRTHPEELTPFYQEEKGTVNTKGVGHVFNVFTDSITDFSDDTPETTTKARQQIKGFNVFTDSLFDDDSVGYRRSSNSVKPNTVKDISDEDLYQPAKKIEVTPESFNEPEPLNLGLFKKTSVEEEMEYEEKNEPVMEYEEEVVEETIEEVKPTVAPVSEPKEVMKRPNRPYKLPSPSLLNEVSYTDMSENKTQAEIKIVLLNNKFNSLGLKAKVKDYIVAPAFTRFEIEVSNEMKIGQFTQVQKDLMMALEASQINILAPIPGTSFVGIDIPNVKRGSVSFKETLQGLPFEKRDNKLLVAIGKDIVGKVVSVEIDKTPHLLVAGATGSGKSVCLNTIIISLMMRATPDEVKIMLIDPKRVEFTSYANIPHLLCPVITDAKKASVALKKLCNEMDARFDLFSKSGKKNIGFYNNYARSVGQEPLPYIVVVIDELGDLMLVAKNDVEESIRRITQLARAAGIHLIVATQRPSVDVITGVIKANIPSRIAFAVSANQDSRTILDEIGAEDLLGNGDMLMHLSGQFNTNRVQGAFLSDEEIDRVTDYARSQRNPEYNPEFLNLEPPEPESMSLSDINIGGDEESDEDRIYFQILKWVANQKGVSTSLIQRNFQLGYPRAARMLDRLAEEGYISEATGSNKPREVYHEHFLNRESDDSED